MLYYPPFDHSHPEMLDEYIEQNPYFDDDHPVRYSGKRPLMLDEITAPDMLHVIDHRDLPHRDYAPLLKYVKLVGIKNNVMKFFVPSPTRINKWNFFVQWTQWGAEVRDTNTDPVEAARLLYWAGDVRVHCGCPSFLFYGYNFILSQMDAAMRPEMRYPRIRNPQLKGILCKHGRRVIKTLGFHLGDMAKAIKEQRRI